MKAYLGRSFIFILFLILFFSSFTAWANNQNVGEINALLEKEKMELNILGDKIKKQTRALSKMGKRKFSILKKQRILDDQLKMRERELKVYKWNLKINKNRIIKLTNNIKENRKKLLSQKKAMAGRIRTIYKEGSMFPVKVIFSSDDFIQLIRKVKYMESIAEYDTNLFTNYAEQVKILNLEKKSLLNAKDKIIQFKDFAEFKKKEIAIEKNEKKQFLIRLNKEKNNNKRLKDELVEASRQLNRLIAKLEKKKILGGGLDISDKKGRLTPPVQGKFINKFGRKRDKKYDTFMVYNGVNIRTPKGSSVRVIFTGNILYTGSLEGYGNIVIVGHGNKYHSLYGHLDEIITQVGKSVRPNQIIGRSGDSGSILGESLYFEIRHNGVPIEPTAWLDHKIR